MQAHHVIFITGAAGYVGAMLADQFSKRDDVERVVCLDKAPQPELLRANPKIVYVRANLSDAEWERQVERYAPDIIIHAAWQIRELYGSSALEWKWNIEGSDRVFEFAFSHPSVRRLIHFSTVASYGAFASNSMEHFFTETEDLRESEYRYAEEKRMSELHLREHFDRSDKHARVAVVRPVAITGPRGRNDSIRFGLQSALSGKLKGRSFVYTLVSFLVSYMPVTAKWLRQYVHEDDLTDIVGTLAFGEYDGMYEVFNLAPPGPVVTGSDMARMVGKRALPVVPSFVRVVFFIMWHLTRGKVPTGKGSWRGYSYPIAVDGSKVTRMLGFQYRFGSRDAFIKNEGRYAAR